MPPPQPHPAAMALPPAAARNRTAAEPRGPPGRNFPEHSGNVVTGPGSAATPGSGWGGVGRLGLRRVPGAAPASREGAKAEPGGWVP